MEVKSSISIDVNKSSEEKYQLIRKEIIEVTNGHNTRKKVNIVNNDCIKINKKNFKIKTIITKYTSFLDEYQPTTSERFYCICQDIREVVLCKYCQEVKSKYINLKKGYTTYCSNKCATKSPDRTNNIKNTNLERYGCANVFQSEKIKEKSKNTIQEKYNVDNISKLDEIKEKKCQTSLRNYGVKHTLQAQEVKALIKQTNLEKRNVEYPSQCPKVREKVIQTNLKKYGKEHTFQVKGIRDKGYSTMLEKYNCKHALQISESQEKFKQTNLKRYGVENPLQSERFQEKVKQTNLERYGCSYTFQSEEIKEKSRQTNLERYGAEYSLQSEVIKEKARQTSLVNFYNNQLIKKDYIKDYEPLFSLDEYKGVKKSYYKFKHRKCGHIFQCRIENGLFPKCPKCYPPNISDGERELAKFVNQYVDNIVFNSRNIIPPKELDIYLPDYNLAIEYNGLYWHSTAQGKGKDYHISKSIDCWKKDIELIQIFENEWAIKQDAVKSLILQNINKLPYYIDIKDCVIKEVDQIEALDFLEIHSLYGAEDYDLKLGLYYNNHLVSLMGLDDYKDHYLIRNYCNYNFTEINSLPIFLDYFSDKKLKILSDLRFDRGKELVQNNFIYQKYVKPNQVNFSDYFTEEKNQNENTYIFDCGYFCYLMTPADS